ncbi:hypothetical protein [Desulfovibrio gilichinskyi]|uniref:Uncharacterized protein n=1 Tax=Desulfovibrio gilichinskyi TaxID=1519643 RepID=A0A1X7DXF0_9BACT|nr:hypothetical protein [Desulfovibrio gilichinskyi]SMF23516.1 hypothetical protein SAMN06295933_2329 [Desulfovibrio gilichinskyi]
MIYLKNIFPDFKNIVAKNYITLLIFCLYLAASYLNRDSGYGEYYFSCLAISLVLVRIGVKEMDIKFLRFNALFRVVLVYFILLLVTKLSIKITTLMNYNLISLKSYIEILILKIRPEIDYKFYFDGPFFAIAEAFLYSLISPFIYCLVCRSFSFKKIFSISTKEFLLGIMVFVFIGMTLAVFILSTFGLFDSYIYIPIFSLYYVVLTVLCYVVGKNSFSENYIEQDLAQ